MLIAVIVISCLTLKASPGSYFIFQCIRDTSKLIISTSKRIWSFGVLWLAGTQCCLLLCLCVYIHITYIIDLLCCPMFVCDLILVEGRVGDESYVIGWLLSWPHCNPTRPLSPDFSPAGISDSTEMNIMHLTDRESQRGWLLDREYQS